MVEVSRSLRGRTCAALRWPADPGDAAAPLTVLLHGFLDHAGAWERVAAGLPGERLAIDHRGHGRSAHNPPGDTYLFADYLADLDAWLDAVAPGAPVRLVGHSMGGTIATLYAGARPERVCALVSVDGLGMADGVDGTPGDPVADRMVRYLDGVRTPPRNRVLPSVEVAAERLRLAHPSLDAAWALRLAERGTRPAPGGVVWAFDPAHRVRSPIPYRHAHHVPLLRRIRCPVLSVRPSEAVFAAADVAALEGAVADLRTVTVEGAGHMVHLDQPALLSAHIREFWARAGGCGAARAV